MMDIEATKKAARTAIQKIANTYQRDIITILFARVVSVNAEARTCSVTPVSGRSNTIIEDVALSIDKNDGLIIEPAIDSTVAVAISTELDPFVFSWSDVDKMIMKGGAFGGLTKTQELKDQLDKLNAQLQAVISSLTNFTPVPGDGGAALKTFFTTEIIGKTEADFSDIENTNITHGDK